MDKTSQQFLYVIDKCRNIFQKKLQDYGPAWRLLRLESITDQLYIKANRIRTIQLTGQAKINEQIDGEFVGLINYSIIALIQRELGFADEIDIDQKQALELYDKYASLSLQLMQKKNHDYGEAWRQMRVSSLTDLILMKIFRIKQIEDNKGKTIASEGVENNYFDIINYSVFALIKLWNLDENKEIKNNSL